MKTIIEMARDAGLVRAGDGWTEPARWGLTEFERFATLVKAARDAELLEGVEMPDQKTYLGVDEEPDFTYYTPDQLRETVAAAVLRERESCAKEADHWFEINKTHRCGDYIAAAIRNRSNT